MAYPLTPKAEEALAALDFPIVDCHHHIWSDSSTPRAQALFAGLDYTKYGRKPLIPPKKFPPGFEVKAPPMPDEAINGFLSGIDASFGTHQVLMQDYHPEDLQADFAHAKGVKVCSTVHLECGWTEGTPDGESVFIQGIYDKTGQIGAAIVGHVNMLEPDVSKTEALLRSHMKNKSFRGIRHSFSHDPTGKQMPHAPIPDMPSDPHFIKNLELFKPENLDLSYDLWLYSHQLPSTTELVKKFPKNRFVLNHFATPLYVGQDDKLYEAWKKDIAALAAASPNVYAKLSGLMAMLGLGYGMYMEEWPNKGPSAEQIAQSRFGEMIKHAVDVFGVDRVMFGSNFPVDKGMSQYGELLAAFVLVLQEMGVSKEDMKKIFHDNAKTFYRIECCA